MARRPRRFAPAAPLAPVPAEILDQFVRQGPLSPEEFEAAGAALDAFERGPWGSKFPSVVASWRRAWAPHTQKS